MLSVGSGTGTAPSLEVNTTTLRLTAGPPEEALPRPTAGLAGGAGNRPGVRARRSSVRAPCSRADSRGARVSPTRLSADRLWRCGHRRYRAVGPKDWGPCVQLSGWCRGLERPERQEQRGRKHARLPWGPWWARPGCAPSPEPPRGLRIQPEGGTAQTALPPHRPHLLRSTRPGGVSFRSVGLWAPGPGPGKGPQDTGGQPLGTSRARPSWGSVRAASPEAAAMATAGQRSPLCHDCTAPAAAPRHEGSQKPRPSRKRATLTRCPVIRTCRSHTATTARRAFSSARFLPAARRRVSSAPAGTELLRLPLPGAQAPARSYPAGGARCVLTDNGVNARCGEKGGAPWERRSFSARTLANPASPLSAGRCRFDDVRALPHLRCPLAPPPARGTHASMPPASLAKAQVWTNPILSNKNVFPLCKHKFRVSFMDAL